MTLKEFEARRRAEHEFLDAYIAELVQQLKARVERWPEGYTPSDQDLEACSPEKTAETVRLSGNPALADEYLVAWERAVQALNTSVGLEMPVTDHACELWYEARDASDAAWEQFERMNAQVDAWLDRCR